MKRVQVTTSQ